MRIMEQEDAAAWTPAVSALKQTSFSNASEAFVESKKNKKNMSPSQASLETNLTGGTAS